MLIGSPIVPLLNHSTLVVGSARFAERIRTLLDSSGFRCKTDSCDALSAKLITYLPRSYRWQQPPSLKAVLNRLARFQEV